jgi:hypothetical protein
VRILRARDWAGFCNRLFDVPMPSPVAILTYRPSRTADHPARCRVAKLIGSKACGLVTHSY